MRKWLKDLISEEDMDEWQRTHYKNGLRKWSATPLIDRVAFLVAIVALIVSILKNYA